MKKNLVNSSIVSKSKLLFICLFVFTLLPISAYAAIVDLGTAADFAILGGSAVTNTGSSVINNGNVGSSPTPAVSGFGPVVVNNGILYTAASSVTAQAHTDAATAYSTLSALTPSIDLTGQDLGGLTLTAGVYSFSSSAQLTGTLILDGTGDYVFLIGSTLTTASSALVTATNGANVYWVVGSSATLGTGTTFIGNILALASITLDGGGTLDGRALAINGAVTISAAETINVPTTVPEPATLCLLGFGVLSMIRRKKSA